MLDFTYEVDIFNQSEAIGKLTLSFMPTDLVNNIKFLILRLIN